MHIHDLHATILHLLGLNHETLTYRHGGRDFRLDRCPRRGRPKNHGMSHGAGRARLQLTPPAGLSPTQVMTEREILIKAVDRAVAQGWLGIRDEGYRYDGVVLHQGTVRVNASRLDSQELAFQPPRPDAAFRRVRRSLFRQRPPPMDRSGPLCPMLGGIRVHRHRVLLAVPPGPTAAGASTSQISGRVSLRNSRLSNGLLLRLGLAGLVLKVVEGDELSGKGGNGEFDHVKASQAGRAAPGPDGQRPRWSSCSRRRKCERRPRPGS